MRILLVALLLVPLLEARPGPFLQVVDDWQVDGRTLRAWPRRALGATEAPAAEAWPIRFAEVASRLGIEEGKIGAYLDGLDPALPLVVESAYKSREVVGIRSLTAERLEEDLRVELGRTGEAIHVRLVNKGKVAHRVIRPNDGSESGWREPEIYFEREVDGKWVRGNKPGRCGMFAQEWQRDVVELKPGEALPLEGYLPLGISFDLPKAGKVKLRAVYVYSGGRMARAKDGKLDPGPMGRTPPFTLVSDAVEVEIG